MFLILKIETSEGRREYQSCQNVIKSCHNDLNSKLTRKPNDEKKLKAMKLEGT